MTKKKIQLLMVIALIPTVVSGVVLLNVFGNAEEGVSGWRMIAAGLGFVIFLSLFILFSKKLKEKDDAERYGN